MSLLTDSEQKKLLDELYNTSRKIKTSVRQAIVELGIPDSIQALREEQARRHAEGEERKKVIKRGLIPILKAFKLID